MAEELDFPKDEGWGTKTEIYVPKTKDRVKPISDDEFEARTKEVRNFLTKKFGGTTTVSGLGTYTSKSGKVIKEPVNVVVNYSDNPEWLKKDKVVQKFVERKGREWGQESIQVTFESPKRPNSRSVLIFMPKKSVKRLKEIS